MLVKNYRMYINDLHVLIVNTKQLCRVHTLEPPTSGSNLQGMFNNPQLFFFFFFSYQAS